MFTQQIIKQSAWKFDKPTDPYVNPECPQDASDYEKVVRYNYSSYERFALIEVSSFSLSFLSPYSNLPGFRS